MSTEIEYFDAFVPARFCDERVLRFVDKLKNHRRNERNAKVLETGVEFEVEFVVCKDGYEEDIEFTNGLILELVRENKISLTFRSRFSTCSGGDEMEARAPDWESILEDCPTLILREILTKRLEGPVG